MTSVLLAIMTSCGHGRTDTDNSSSNVEVTTSCTTSTMTSTSTTSTTSSTTTSTTTTTTTVATSLRTETTTPMTETVVVTEPEPVYIPESFTEPSYIEPVTEQFSNNLPITDYEIVLLRNIVANEYGSDYHGYGGAPVTLYERACVVAVVMNRVNSPQFPNTIEGVLTQPSQFSGYWACNYEWSNVTDNVREGVNYYFAHQEEFGNWLYFEGDGRYNYFH